MPSVTRRAARSPGHREAVVSELAQAVDRLLREGHGYTALGVQRIADEAGIARSTFYLYFPDKTALLMRITESATQALFAAAEAWLADGFADIGALERTLLDVIAQQREHAVLLAALSEVSGYDLEVAAFWRGRVGGFIDLLARRIATDRTPAPSPLRSTRRRPPPGPHGASSGFSRSTSPNSPRARTPRWRRGSRGRSGRPSGAS